MTQTSHIIIALTGQIGSGKSSAAKIFQDLGATIIDADILAREVVKTGSPGLLEISKHFGAEFLLPDGALDRKKLGALIFSDKIKREELENILHPKIHTLFKSRLNELKSNSNIVLYVVPLYYESRFSYEEISKVIVVYASKESCITRIMKRDGSSRELAEKKYASQKPIDEKVAKADWVIDNEGSLEKLKTEISRIWHEISSARE